MVAPPLTTPQIGLPRSAVNTAAGPFAWQFLPTGESPGYGPGMWILWPHRSQSLLPLINQDRVHLPTHAGAAGCLASAFLAAPPWRAHFETSHDPKTLVPPPGQQHTTSGWKNT